MKKKERERKRKNKERERERERKKVKEILVRFYFENFWKKTKSSWRCDLEVDLIGILDQSVL